MGRVTTLRIGDHNHRVLLDSVDIGGRWHTDKHAELAGKQVLTAVRITEMSKKFHIVAKKKGSPPLKFDSIQQAGKQLHCDITGIYKCLKGEQYTAKGYTWRQQ
jgi:hypothetical protein